jgi:adenine phosphoribosyltransferase
MDIKSLIRDIPDFPIPGILFKDITTLLKEPNGLQVVVDRLTTELVAKNIQIDSIVGIESRGFIFGSALAYKLGLGFVLVRKPKKLPAAVHHVEYELEYGKDRLEMHQDALAPGNRVLIVDDLLATGGTAAATSKLVSKAGATLAGYGFVIELTDLQGRQKLADAPVISLVEY